MSYDAFFHQATGHKSPFEYQRRLAGGDLGKDCQSQLIDIPTGMGKTAAVVLAWIWNRIILKRDDWPRRLVYCLPMRTLVEQTERDVRTWLLRLAREMTKPKDKSELRWLALHSPVILMGGEDTTDWDIYPEKPAILIGTQDMLLSRALNRGYGMSRYRWPMHFGLLNNDCLWVMDETQLMGVGAETSAQLDGLRQDKKMVTFRLCPTWWMSATLNENRLATVDHPKPDSGWTVVKLNDAERSTPLFTNSKKPVFTCDVHLDKDTEDQFPKELAQFIRQHHQPGTLTLVIANRVSRAQEVYTELTKGKIPLYPKEKVALIHSRFRVRDRETHTKLLLGANGQTDRIVIATQAVEAGVDISARLLITELAPWSSLVQRFGRCNRKSETPDAQIFLVEIHPKDEKDTLLLPYSKEELEASLHAIKSLADAGLKSLEQITIPEASVIRPIIRRRDLVDLFDTTPDLCGQDLDISRYIRDGEDKDVQLFWRELGPNIKPDKDNSPLPKREELCRVSIGDAADFFNKPTTQAWQWNPLEDSWDSWDKAKKPRPGAVYLLSRDSGGYDETLGWTGSPKHKSMTPHPPQHKENDSYDKDKETWTREWETISAHTHHVMEKIDGLAADLNLVEPLAKAFHQAALWHDVGKAHAVFQEMITQDNQKIDKSQLWAKSESDTKPKAFKLGRRYFRHELASALAWLQTTDNPEQDLIAYLIAAHHGKIRLSIRSLPNEPGDVDNPDRLFARGIWDGDPLPAVPLGEMTTPEILKKCGTDLSLTGLDLTAFMPMGQGRRGPSWLGRTVALRNQWGPFKLAFFETILRAADAQGSKLA